MPNFVRVERSERVDLEDFDHGVSVSQREVGELPLANFATNPNGTRMWILDGFEASDAGSLTVQVIKGRGILSRREGALVKYGALAVEGDAARSVDITSFADGTYGVYVRFEYRDGQAENRVFWDDSGTSEFTKNIPSRKLANWTLRVAAASPGLEWYKVADVVRSSGPDAIAIQTQRVFYFEGDEVSVPSFATTWGSGNDRDGDRAQYGVKDLQTFIEFTKKKLEELQTGTNPAIPTGVRVWDAPVASLDDVLPLTGSGANHEMRGSIIPKTNALYDLGDISNIFNLRRWRNISAVSANLEGGTLNAFSLGASSISTITGSLSFTTNLGNLLQLNALNGGNLFIGSQGGDIDIFEFGGGDINLDTSGSADINLTSAGGDIDITAFDVLFLRGDRVVSQDPHLMNAVAPATPAVNTVYQENVPKAWGTLTTGGSPAWNNTFNVDTGSAPVISGGNVTIPFATNMVGAYTVVVTVKGAETIKFWTTMVQSPGAGSFIIAMYEVNGFSTFTSAAASARRVNLAAESRIIDFAVFAKQ